MDLYENVEVHAHGWRSKLEIIDRAISEEMSRSYDQRRLLLLLFLYSEKKAYSLALNGVDTLHKDSREQEAENTLPRFGQERLIDRSSAQVSKCKTLPLNKRTYRIVTWGGIGDALLITPTIRTLKRRYPDCKVHVYCIYKAHKEALENNKYIDRLQLIDRRSMAIYYLLSKFKLVEIQPSCYRKSKPNNPYNRTGALEIHTSNYGQLRPSLFYMKRATEIIGEMMGVEIDDPRPNCFLTESEEMEGRKMISKYSNPVAIHVTTRSSPNKQWPIENWEKLIQANPDYSFLQLGEADEELVSGATDLRGKTSIRQAFAVIKAAKAFVGVDSVFAHAATAFQTPAVVLFGATTPVVWGYDENQNLYKPPPCSPCIDLLLNDPCPYGRECMSNITVSDVENALSLSMARAA